MLEIGFKLTRLGEQLFQSEAAGIEEEIFNAVARCDPDRLLVTGSPLGPEGKFYEIETDPNASFLLVFEWAMGFIGTAEQIENRLVCFAIFGGHARNGVAKIGAVEFCVFVDRAG